MADRPTPADVARAQERRRHPDRREVLLAAIRAQGGVWTTGRAKALYRRAIPGHVYRTNVRGDLVVLRDAGHLAQRTDERGRRFYLYIPKGGDAV